MTLGETSAAIINESLRGKGLVLRIGPFAFRIISDIPSVQAGLLTLYSDYHVMESEYFADFGVCITEGAGWRRWFRRQAVFRFDGVEPFLPLPVAHAFPLLEWAMNWCISSHAHQYLLLHAAVVERNGCAAILPAPSGSGKSTLCAALVSRGWRLLSDEMALVSLEDASITPLGRPISLKNQSIEIIRDFAPGAVFSAVTKDTAKGRVTHMKVPKPQLMRIAEPARPRWVVFPRYVANSPPVLSPRSKADSMLEIGRNSFNYVVLGKAGFDALSNVVRGSDCFDFKYGNLSEAIALFDGLVDRSLQ